MKSLLNFVLFLIILISITSCKKEQNDSDLQEQTLAVDETIAETTFEEISEIGNQAYKLSVENLKSSDDLGDRLGDCVTITLDTTVMPHVLTIDFGEENCLCRDGKWRRGKIIVTFTGHFYQTGAVITHTLDNYYVNDNWVQGTKVKTNLGPNINGEPEFTSVVNGSITFNETGIVINWESEHLRTWIEGYNSIVWWDDVFLITGNGAHTHSQGGGFTRTITTPLRRESSCHHIVSGIVETVPLNRPTRILDYGDGTCDNLATLTVGNKTFVIRLH
ncbi:MAG TPA: hypothetical protein PLI65_07010 [Bacteroidales bacterium]|nr:hypothetical protein [Bacteroidales bacterium]